MINRSEATEIAEILAGLEVRGDWRPTDDQRIAHRGLERTLAIRIQAGQPELEAMNDRLISSYAESIAHLVPDNIVHVDYSRRQHVLPFAA